MAVILFDIAIFRRDFPAYTDETAYPDATLEIYFNIATCYVSDVDGGCLSGDCRLRALNLMTAHLLFVTDLIAAGSAPGFVTAATIDRVTVSVQPNQNTSQWQWWLMTSPYGPQLLALLGAKSIGGFYIGGSPERSAYRKVGGGF